MGDNIGSRAIGGSGDIEAVGRDASNGVNSSSARGGRIGACILVLMYVAALACKLAITCKSWSLR
jgi:hypothetical protein